MWFVASIPFWLIGLWCIWSAGAALASENPNESRQRRNERVFGNLLAAGAAFYAAARIAS